MFALVLDKNRKPLTPCRMARARLLLKLGRAAVFRRYPFTIILKDRTVEGSVVRPHRLKIDPGSKVTGMALVQEPTAQVVLAAEIQHRGQKIKAALQTRRTIRRGRRQRKTRYRQPRFDNRRRRAGWLPPSLESRVANVLTWVERLRRLCPTVALSCELVRFDMQQMENPEIAGVEYQQGTLAGYELREYLLEKWGRRCAYCGRQGVPLQIDHIQAQSRGGTNRVANLTLSCPQCNQAKGNLDIATFLKRKPQVLQRISAQAQVPLPDAAAVNTTRWELCRRLQATGLELETDSGGRTKYNRSRLGFPKTHWLDAACVGGSTPDGLKVAGVQPLGIQACGHGRRNRCWTDRHGFLVRHGPRTKSDRGFRTGDIVEAVIPSGKHRGRVAIRFGQSFQVGGVSAHPRHLRKLHQADGYNYGFAEPILWSCNGGAAPPTPEGSGFPPRRSL
jgi:5-methylcytosine-specific restriction endonuclease McrA